MKSLHCLFNNGSTHGKLYKYIGNIYNYFLIEMFIANLKIYHIFVSVSEIQQVTMPAEYSIWILRACIIKI